MVQTQNKKVKIRSTELPEIPDRIYFSIGDVSRLCDLRSHVLRYWEQEFEQLSPTKRRGNRRNYMKKDILLIRRIRSLLYDQGYTIEGARKKLAQEARVRSVPETTASVPSQRVEKAIQDLESILNDLS